ncbi:MAG: hypothetical protein KAH11_03910 [Rhodospirillales bacterium]|nr:hypothetical protein [Rhodospirillales bacterium]
MSIFIAVVAFFMAFGALWFTSEIARRLDLKNQSAVKPHMGPMQESLRRAERQIRELTLGLEAAERKIRSLDTRNRPVRDGFSNNREGEASAPNDISALDIIRGAGRFYPSDTLKN